MSFQQGLPPNYQSWNSEPWVWLAIPAGIVIAMGALAICIHTRRRRRRLRTGVLANPSGAQALERDLWEMWGRNAGTTVGDAEQGGVHPSMAAIPGGRWTRPRTRWAWVGGGGGGGGTGNQNEEGLNELGEAPPPYDPRALGSQGGNKPEDNGVGGGVVPRGDGAGGVEAPPPVLLAPGTVGGTEGGAAQRREMQPPPDYVEASTEDCGRVSPGDPEGSGANGTENSSPPTAQLSSSDHVHDISRPEPAVIHNATPATTCVSPSKPSPPSDESLT